MAEEEDVKLLRTWSSRFALRAVWALELKGIRYESVFEDLSNKSSELLRYNPVHGKVPVLVHNGRAVSESLVILEYIEETWPTQHPLLPHDPFQRATARFWAKFSHDQVMPSICSVFTKYEEEQEAAIAPAMDNLRIVEEQLKGKRFFAGDNIGLVDIAFGWLVNLVPVYEEVTGLKLIDSGRFPCITAWMKEFSDFPAIKDTWPPHDKLVTKFSLLHDTLRSK